MLSKLRRRMQDEQGFTLIELLVVILIIGILAAIAIPAFLNQTGKAHDASAKSQLNTAATTMQSLATDNNGSYANVTLAQLKTNEPSLNVTDPTLAVPAVGTNNYTLTSSVAGTGDTFTLAYSNGVETRTCTAGSVAPASGCATGSW